MAATLVELVEQVKTQQQWLETHSDDVDTKGLLLQMHKDMTEFMEDVLVWMQAREAGVPAKRFY